MNRTKLLGRICSYCGSNITTKTNFNIHRRFASQPTVANVFDRKAKLQQRITAFSQQDCEIYDYIKDEVGNQVNSNSHREMCVIFSRLYFSKLLSSIHISFIQL